MTRRINAGYRCPDSGVHDYLQSALEVGNQLISEATRMEWLVVAEDLNADVACEVGGVRVSQIRREAYAYTAFHSLGLPLTS